MEEDKRFASSKNDPRFKRLSASKRKVKVDKRFSSMLTDEAFLAPQSTVDSRGFSRKGTAEKKSKTRSKNASSKPAKKSKLSMAAQLAQRDLRRVYEFEEEEDEDEKKIEENKKPEGDEADSASSHDHDESSSAEKSDAASDEDESSSDDDSSSDDGSSSDSDSTDVAELDDSDADEEPIVFEGDADIPLVQPTRRLALVAQDWERTRAVDVFVVATSFAPPGGTVQKVEIYPSDFGLEKMKAEERYGPSVFRDGNESDGAAPEAEGSADQTGLVMAEHVDLGDSSDDDGDEDVGDQKKKTSYGIDDDGLKDSNEGVDPRKLREYELGKLRYYYAVITTDSVATANAIYDSCDGLEFLRSGNTIDLRFVADDHTFPHDAVATCTSIPTKYKPPSFNTQAITQTSVKLTWDEPDPSREKLKKAHWTAEDLKDDDLKAYLASDADSEEDKKKYQGAQDDDLLADDGDDDAGNHRAKYQKLLAALKKGNNSSVSSSAFARGREQGEAEDDDDEGATSDSELEGDMEITFTPGLVEAANDALARKQQRDEAAADGGESNWQRYLAKRKAKKANRKATVRDLKRQSELRQRELLAGRDPDETLAAKPDKASGSLFDDDDVPADLRSSVSAMYGDEHAGEHTKHKKPKKHKKGEEDDKDDEAAQKERAELELLLIDEGDVKASGTGAVRKGYSLKALNKQAKAKKASKRARKQAEADVDGESWDADFKVNPDDPRFTAIHEDRDYAIDPTDQRFKSRLTPGLESFMSASRDRHRKRQRT